MALPLILGVVALVKAAEVTLAVCGTVILAAGISELINEMSSSDDDADDMEEAAPVSTTDACSDCPPPDEDDEEQAGKDAKRMSEGQLKRAVRRLGYDNVHHFKDEYGLHSTSDIFVDKAGNLYAGPTKGQPGIPQRLGINIHGY